MICDLLVASKARATNNRLYLGNSWFPVNDLLLGHQSQQKFLQTLAQRSPEIQTFLFNTPPKEVEAIVHNEIQKFLAIPTAPPSPTTIDEVPLSPDQIALLESHQLVLDVTTGKEVLWSIVERRPSEWSPLIFSKKLPAKAYKIILENAQFTRITFDPFKGTQTQWKEVSEGKDVQVLNSYRPPLWYKQDLDPTQYQGKQEVYPDLFKYLVANLVPTPQDQAMLLDWLALAVFDRPHSILSLRGIRGNGKTIFKHLTYHLVGNFLEAQQRIFGDFNAEMREKRIIGVDDNEELGTLKGHSLRKRLTNPTITYNKKNVQTEVSEKQYASIIVCSNTERQFYVEFDERKIVSLLLTDKKMETWPNMSEAIYDWLRPFEQPDEKALSPAHIEFLRQIGMGLFTRLLNRRPNVALEFFGGWFWADVISSLPSFKRYVVDMVRTSYQGEALDYELIKAEYSADVGRGEIPQWSTLVRWMNGGFHLWGNKLFTEIDDKGKKFYPNMNLSIRK